MPALVHAGLWRPAFMPTMAVYADLFATWKSDPAGFSAARLSVMRLLGRDLGVSPSAAALRRE